MLTWHLLHTRRPSAKPSAPAAAAAAAGLLSAPSDVPSGAEADPLAKAERTLVHCKASLERHKQQLEKQVQGGGGRGGGLHLTYVRTKSTIKAPW